MSNSLRDLLNTVSTIDLATNIAELDILTPKQKSLLHAIDAHTVFDIARMPKDTISNRVRSASNDPDAFTRADLNKTIQALEGRYGSIFDLLTDDVLNAYSNDTVSDPEDISIVDQLRTLINIPEFQEHGNQRSHLIRQFSEKHPNIFTKDMSSEVVVDISADEKRTTGTLPEEFWDNLNRLDPHQKSRFLANLFTEALNNAAAPDAADPDWEPSNDYVTYFEHSQNADDGPQGGTEPA